MMLSREATSSESYSSGFTSKIVSVKQLKIKGRGNMCTSIFTETKDGLHILSRTMDFSFPLNPNPLFMPRKYTWVAEADDRVYVNSYGFVGAGNESANTYMVADGVNEKGLSIAELYLPGEVHYQTEAEDYQINLAPHEFIIWALGSCDSILDLENRLQDINIVGIKAPLIGVVTPIHWIITDETGRCVVIEPTQRHLVIKENPVGVMTNTPCFEWHVENLRNYLNVQPKQYEPKMFGDYKAIPFSQGTGTMGLPGGYTPPERFVRAAFFKEHIGQAQNEIEGVSNAYHILATARIPKGIVVTAEGAEDYSQYVGTMCNESRSYYFNAYENNQVAKVTLTKELLKSQKPIMFMADKVEMMKELN